VRRLLLGFLSALALVAAASGASFEGLAVSSVRFSPPEQPLSVEHRSGLVRVRSGQPLTAEDVRLTIYALYETGRYSNISVDAEPVGDGVRVTILTELKRYVGTVRVQGSESPPTENQITNAAKLTLGEPYTDQVEAGALESVRALLKDNGFLTPRIDFKTVLRPNTQQVDVLIEIAGSVRSGIGRLILTGDSGLAPDEAKRIARWTEGKSHTYERIQRGLTRLREHLQETNYLRARVEVVGRDPRPSEKLIDLVVDIQRGPRVLINVEGWDFSGGQLRRYLPVFEEGVVDEDLLAEGARNLADFLQTKGYFDAQVGYRQQSRDPEEQIVLTYTVDPGPRQKLAQVSIRGNRFFDRETLRERMFIREKSFSLRRGRFSSGLLQRDIDVVEDLYRSNGYRDVAVTSRVERDYRGKQGDLAVFLEVEEGRPTFVESLRLEGIDRLLSSGLGFQLASAEGQAFSETSVATDRDLILAEYYNAGYQNASFDWSAEPGSDENSVHLAYVLDEGAPLRVRRSVLGGLVEVRRELAERQIVIEPDGPLSQDQMYESQRRLYDLGVFARVDVALQNPGGKEPEKTVLLQVEEARRWTIGVGGGAEFARIGGVSDPTKPVGSTTFAPRLTVELTRLNFRGRGHTISLRTRVSELQQRALFTYLNPRWTGSERWRMTFSGLYDTSRNVRTFRAERAEGAVQFEHELSRASTALYRYTFRRTRETLLASDSPSRVVRAALFSGTYIQDRRDNPLESTRGTFNSVDLGVASGYWGSQPDFFRILARNSSYYEVAPRVVLARTLQLGVMLPWGGSDWPTPDCESESHPDRPLGPLVETQPDPRIPISERYFAGGANSHRGFPFNQAGPRDRCTGFPLGGGAQVLNSVELRVPLIGENIRGVLFWDAGNVYSRPKNISLSSKQRIVEGFDGKAYDFDYMMHAVGIGVRYRTPIGPVRFDLAYGLNPPRFAVVQKDPMTNQDVFRDRRISSFQFHFSLGQTF